jgi:hypothetical protein
MPPRKRAFVKKFRLIALPVTALIMLIAVAICFLRG